MVGFFGLELEPRRQHLLHQQAGGDGLQRVVDRLADGFVRGVDGGDQVGEPGAGLARRVAGGAADDLHDLGETGAIADGQRVLAPDPVEALLRHAERDNDVHMVAVVLLRRVLQRGGDAIPLGAVVVDQVRDAQGPAVRRPDQLEAGGGVGALPLAQRLDDVLHLPDLVLRALARIDVGDVDNSLLGRVQHGEYVVGIGAGIEEVADVEPLEVLVAVELLVVGVGDALELRLVSGRQHRFRVAAKIGAGHRDEMHLVARDELAEVQAQLVVGARGNVVELVHRDQPVVERLHAEPVDREAEGGVGADEHLVLALEERADRLHLAAILARRVAQVPARRDAPVRPEAMAAERLVVEAGADALLRHDDDRLLAPLVGELVERDEHQRAALARRGRRLDEEVLLAALFVGLLLHGAHAERVGFRGAAGAGIGD